jgi:hypothetical protein
MRKDIVKSHNIPDSTLGKILQNRSWFDVRYQEKLNKKRGL